MRDRIADFFEVIAGAAFNVPSQDAAEYFRAKGLRPSFNFADMMGEEHATAFTVAKMMDMDLLLDVQKSLDEAISNGVLFRDWAEDIIPMLQEKGWWGRKEMRDPITGKVIVAQLGSPRRLETIFRTNLQTAYSAGKWQQIMDQADIAPYLMYDAVDDFRTRAQHKAWDNKVLPVTDKFWQSHYPPNGWGCRCGVIQLSDDDLEELGLQVDPSPRIKFGPWTNPRTGRTEQVPVGIDPGFNYNAGKARFEYLNRLAQQKAGSLEGEIGKAAQAGLDAAARQAQATMPARTKRKTKAELLADLEARALADLADTFVMPSSVVVEGVSDVLDAIEDVNSRYGLGKLVYIGDIKKGPYRYKMPARATAGYVPAHDSIIFRGKATDPKELAEIQKNNLEHAKRDPWSAVADALRKPFYFNSEAAKIAESLPVGRPWTFNHSAKGIAYHEMGHRLHAMNKDVLDTILANGFRAGWHHLVSKYGSMNHSEFMAEAFTIYMTGTNEDLRRIYPQLLDWFRRYDRRAR